jgi:hypothetical protein
MIDDWEVPAIERVELLQSRRLARLGVPGLAGDLHQDLGAEALTVAITGSLAGDDRRSGFLQRVQQLFQAGDPVPFVADIVESSELEDVVVVGFEVVETGEWADAIRYRILLRQYVEPPPPPSPLPDLSFEGFTGLPELPDVADLAGSLLDGLDLPQLLAPVPSLADPTEPIRPALDAVHQAVGDVPGLLGELRSALGLPA